LFEIFFAWLLIHTRIQLMAAHLKKHILTALEAVCPMCGCADDSETHIIFRCPFAVVFWDTIDVRFPPGVGVCRLHEYAARRPVLCPPPHPPSSFSAVGMFGSTGNGVIF
jgi:hypothetical protein